MKNNLLILSAGRRVELVQSFQKELKKLVSDSYVFCTDIAPELSAACHVADKSFHVPRVTDEGYTKAILNLCINHNIGLVIPTIDTELLILADSVDLFKQHGIEVVISSKDLVSLCRDKRKTAQLFSDLKINQPAIYDIDNLQFPCFCKPYDGSCSIGALAIYSENELTQELLMNPKNMFMELIPSSYSEYTVDVYYDKDGVLKCLVPRKRLEVRGGEVSKGVTKKHIVFDYLLEKLKVLKGAKGCITFQFFVNEVSGDIKGLEVNPRFGGGYPLTYAAGANFPKWLIEEYLFNSDIAYDDDWQENLIMLRYDAKVLTHESQ